jgi:hypothetical protein
MFTLRAPQSAALTAVADTLSYDDAALAAEERTAASLTHLFIQEAAKAHAKSEGVDIGDPNLYQTDTWYNALTFATANYATWVEIVGAKSVNVDKSTHSGSINLASIMGSIMALYLGPEASAEWAAVSELLGGPTDPAVTDFMDFWWSHVSSTETDTGVSAGPVIKSADGMVQWAVCYYAMTQSIDDWRVMFVSSTFESISIGAGGLTLQFDMGVYNSDVKTALEAKLAGDITKNINNVPLLSGPQPPPGSLPPSRYAEQIAGAPLLSDTAQLSSTGW